MSEPTEKQVEWAARVLSISGWGNYDYVQEEIDNGGGRRLLAELERQGVKVMKPHEYPHTKARTYFRDAPICPEAEAQEQDSAKS